MSFVIIPLYLGTKNGIDPKEYTARSLQAGGAMALLLDGYNNLFVKLIGRWHSDSLMEYLCQAALPIYKQLSLKMFTNGGHNFSANTFVPVY